MRKLFLLLMAVLYSLGCFSQTLIQGEKDQSVVFGDWLEIKYSITSNVFVINLAPGITSISEGDIITILGRATKSFTYQIINANDEITTGSVTVVSPFSKETFCYGDTLMLSGTWTSSDESIARTQDLSTRTAVFFIGAGEVTLTLHVDYNVFTASEFPITVLPEPVVAISTNEISVGSTTQLAPSTGGTWTSNNQDVASVSSNGIVTGLSSGVSTFTFRSSTTGCYATTSLITIKEWQQTKYNISVVAEPAVGGTVAGGGLLPNGYFDTLRAYPAQGYKFVKWIENDIVIADSDGIVYYVDRDRSVKAIFEPILKPAFNISPMTYCAGETTSEISFNGELSNITWSRLTPENIGLAESGTGVIPSFTTQNNSNDAISATYKVQAEYTYEETVYQTDTTFVIKVNPLPEVILMNDSIRIDFATYATPTFGGTWISNNPAIAIVTSNGYIQGISAGYTNFVFTSAATGCSNATNNLKVYEPITYDVSYIVEPVDAGEIVVNNMYIPMGFIDSIWAFAKPGYNFKHWKINDEIISTSPVLLYGADKNSVIKAVFEGATEKAIEFENNNESLVTIVWNQVEDATAYTITIYSDASKTQVLFTFNFDVNGNIIPSQGFTTAAVTEKFSYSIDDLLTQGQYYYTLVSYDAITNVLTALTGDFGVDNTTNCKTPVSELIKLYPNPASDYAILSIGDVEGEMQVEIYDLNGRVQDRFTTSGNNELRLNVSDYNSGIYFVKLTSFANTQSIKLVIK